MLRKKNRKPSGRPIQVRRKARSSNQPAAVKDIRADLTEARRELRLLERELDRAIQRRQQLRAEALIEDVHEVRKQVDSFRDALLMARQREDNPKALPNPKGLQMTEAQLVRALKL